MEKHSSVVGLPVICLEDGKRLGTVESLIFCPGKKEIRALLLERKGCRIKKDVILYKDVYALGKDAVVIKSPGCIYKMGTSPVTDKLIDKGDILGLRVFTKSGEDIGVVKDVLFDPVRGNIEGVEISDGLFKDIISGRRILPLIGRVEFGEENILVEKEVVDELLEKDGGLKKFL